jgi:hypothetical protein
MRKYVRSWGCGWESINIKMGMSMRKYVRSWEYHKQQNTQTNVLSSHQCADNFFHMISHHTLKYFPPSCKIFFQNKKWKKEVKFSLCRIARLLEKLPAHWWDVNWQHICLCFFAPYDITMLTQHEKMRKYGDGDGISMRKYVRSWESMRKHEKVWESIKYEKVCQKLRKYEKAWESMRKY